jgi:RimJ/RimL family protein N-acetyltransferase
MAETLSLLTPPWPFPQRRVFAGRHITLRPCDPLRDAATLFDAANATLEAAALWEYMYIGPFESKESFAAWMAAGVAGPKEIPFTVFRNTDGSAIGQIRLMELETMHGRGELGSIWYLPEAQRTFANTEACFLLLCHLFDDLRYRRAEWKCDNANRRSFAAAERLGFTYEGTFRQHAVRKGVNRDTAWFSLIDSEWPERKARFEAYLSGHTARL